MNGLYLTGPGTLEWRKFPSASELQDNEVKINLIYGGICGSDISVYKGKFSHAKYPVVPGHELIGKVIEAGANEQEKIGTRVVIMPNSFCGECDHCRAGMTNICSQKKSLGVNTDGGFSEEFIISSKYILPLPDELSNKKAVLIEPFSVVVHALKKITITDKTRIAVIGCGSEGMLAVALTNYLGAFVTAIDINQDKLKKVNTHYEDVKTALPEEVGETFDVVIEAAGAKSSVEQGINILKAGGSMVMIGMTPQADIPVIQMVRNEQTLYGSIIYNFPEDFRTSVNYLLHNDFNVDPVISEILPIKEYKTAYEHAVSGEYGKIILDFEESEYEN